MFWLRACGVSFPEARFVSPSLILPFFILYIRWPVTHRISICPSCSCCSSGKEEILYAAAGAQVYCLDLRLVCCESFSACVMATILLCLWLAISSMVWNFCNFTGCGTLEIEIQGICSTCETIQCRSPLVVLVFSQVVLSCSVSLKWGL